MDLTASNTSLRKSNVELVAQLEELKSRNEELTSNHADLIEGNANLSNQMDGVKGELDKEKAMSASLKPELEMAALKVQTIAMDALLSARAKLMGEYKRGEHTSWDLDEEIRTWEKRVAVVVWDGDDFKEEGDEELAPAIVSPKNIEPDARAKDVAADMEEQGPVEPIASHKDITID